LITQDFLGAAHRIGRTLCRDAVWSGPACNWLGWTARPLGGQLVIGKGSQNASLGYGTAGIGLFLARLYAVTADELVRTTSLGALQHAVDNANLSDPGLFTGCTGIACAAGEAGELLGAGEYKSHACRLLADALEILSTNNGPNEDAALQYAAGIPVLLAVGRRRQLRCAVDLAIRIGEKLAEAIAAIVAEQIQPPQAAMIANALGQLVKETGTETFKQASDRVLQSTADSSPTAQWPAENLSAFPNLYNETGMPVSFRNAQLVRAAQLYPDNSGITKNAVALTEATTASLMRPLVPGDGGYCLSHGVAGKAELLILASNAERTDLFPIAAAAGRTGVTHFSQARMPWPCAVPVGESPNLMFGLAGIGHFYLRLHDPAAIPSLLV
jgi:lantibiotic modifying enzyme